MTETLRQILAELPMRFEGQQARPFSGAINLQARGEGGGSFILHFDQGRLYITDGESRDPSAHVTISVKDLVDLLQRRVSAVELVSEGRMRISGSLPTAARAYVLISRAIR
jgi:alkyl sulfatase BDS1-like metallo-beta-lactamase superfamily hydrolase